MVNENLQKDDKIVVYTCLVMQKRLRTLQSLLGTCRSAELHTLQQTSNQRFLKALTVVQEVPGDWHTSLHMLASIYNLYDHCFLEEFQGLLHWKNINKDVRSCYFQASRLVTFVHDELRRFFIHQFVSERACTMKRKNRVLRSTLQESPLNLVPF